MTPVRRKAIGHITVIGAGPGDAGLLTRRAADALAEADFVVHDPAAVGVLAGLVRPDAEVSVAEGLPGDVAKTLLTAARAGDRTVRVVVGDPYSSADVIAEVKAVARTAVPFDVVPGVPVVTGTATYAGIPVGAAHTVVDVRGGANWRALSAAPGTLVLLTTATALGELSAGLLAAGASSNTAVAVTAQGTSEAQSTVDTTLGELPSAAEPLQQLQQLGGTVGPLVVVVGHAAAARGRLAWWESRPLYGWRVLIPRTREQAGVMSARLRAHGAVPVEVPTIAVEPPRTPAQMERAIKGLVTGRYEWIVFTSTNAVRAVRERFDSFGLDARAFSGVKIACVGEATATAVRAFGITPELVPTEEQSSLGLLADFPPYDDVLDPINRILLPRADIATETLAAGLAERGWEVEDVTAYRTVRAAPPAAAIRDAIKSGDFDAVLFTSSSTVRNLVGIAGKPHARTVVAAIGPKTAETAAEIGLRVDVQPEDASVPALVEELATYAKRLKDNGDLVPPARRGARSRSKTAR